MKSSELLRRVRRLASRRDWKIEITEGKRHTKLRLPGGDTTIPRHSTDLKTGTLHNILKQLGITPEDLDD
jgi:predicted RNA binding protein YcfA (HicA-like mRNA interferase family)